MTNKSPKERKRRSVLIAPTGSRRVDFAEGFGRNRQRLDWNVPSCSSFFFLSFFSILSTLYSYSFFFFSFFFPPQTDELAGGSCHASRRSKENDNNEKKEDKCFFFSQLGKAFKLELFHMRRDRSLIVFFSKGR